MYKENALTLLIALSLIGSAGTVNANTHYNDTATGSTAASAVTSFGYLHVNGERRCVEKSGNQVVSFQAYPEWMCTDESSLTSKYNVLRVCESSAATTRQSAAGAFFSGFGACFCGSKYVVSTLAKGLYNMPRHLIRTIDGLASLFTIYPGPLGITLKPEVVEAIGSYVLQVYRDHPNMTLGQKRAFNCSFWSQIATSIATGKLTVAGISRLRNAGRAVGAPKTNVQQALSTSKDAALTEAGVAKETAQAAPKPSSATSNATSSRNAGPNVSVTLTADQAAKEIAEVRSLFKNINNAIFHNSSVLGSSTSSQIHSLNRIALKYGESLSFWSDLSYSGRRQHLQQALARIEKAIRSRVAPN